jgi:hypothetical protein
LSLATFSKGACSTVNALLGLIRSWERWVEAAAAPKAFRNLDFNVTCLSHSLVLLPDGWGFQEMSSGRVSAFKSQVIGLLHAVQYLRSKPSHHIIGDCLFPVVFFAINYLNSILGHGTKLLCGVVASRGLTFLLCLQYR